MSTFTRAVVAAGGVWLACWVLSELLIGDGMWRPSLALLAKPALFAFLCFVLIVAVKLIRALWRMIRGVNVENVARTAGALTSVAQDRAAGIAEAFKGRATPLNALDL